MTIEFPKFLTIPSTGDQIPIIGFGSGTKWQHKKKGRGEEAKGTLDEDLIAVLVEALNHGFVHLDTAEIYTTRAEIGEALKRSGKKRDEVWITDKYAHTSVYPGTTKRRGPYDSLVEGLKTLGVESVDLFLIHTQKLDLEAYPIDYYWGELEKLYNEGLAKNIGISNFDTEHLESIYKIAKIKPAVIQLEFHPYLQQQSPGIFEYLKDKNILVEAYGPLIPLTKAKPGPLDDVLTALSKKYNASETQILLRWVQQQGIVTVTTSSNPKRMDDIMDSFNLTLSDEDVELIRETGKKKFFRGFIPDPFAKFDDALKAELNLN
ncbi:2-dehydropantolactone reductase (A-specific) activity protein [[Candida] boidinii]|nr:2-dehydropantolactone reductase (A-specific) activity protein [[Candida] boidinii]